MLEVVSDFYKSASVNAAPTLLREIPGYPGYLASRDGEIWSEKRGRFLAQCNHRQGYRQTGVFINGKGKTVLVHRLIAMAFITNPLNFPCVNHLNGKKYDNRPENLEWATHEQNNKHARDTGLNRSVETPLQIYNIRTCELRFFESTLAAARYTGEDQGSFSNALRLPNHRIVGEWLVAKPGEAFPDYPYPLICVETGERFCNCHELHAAGFHHSHAIRASKNGKHAGNKITGQLFHFKHEAIQCPSTH